MKRQILFLPFALLFLALCAGNILAQDPIQSKDRQQAIAEGKAWPDKPVRTITREVNGEMVTFYDIDPPLIHLTISELNKRTERNDPAAIYELGRRYLSGGKRHSSRYRPWHRHGEKSCRTRLR